MTLETLIWIALNPPLPPFDCNLIGRPRAWGELYPPLRLKDLLDASVHLPPLADDAGAPERCAYIAAICDLAGLMSPLNFELAFRRLEGSRIDRARQVVNPGTYRVSRMDFAT